MHIYLVPLVGIVLTTAVPIAVANLSLDFKVTKISASPANCVVANTTYAHGETFKLDCRTQCVCENGRHACSSLCPKEQLPAPEDTISCRSPRLVEVPGHCCKMWLCENPSADVYATCHNSSTSPWTSCSRSCGLGISTRFTATAAGCNQLINLRLCENRKCSSISRNGYHGVSSVAVDYLATKTQKTVREKPQSTSHQHVDRRRKHKMKKKNRDCQHVQYLGPARIRLGECVSRKLYRPKVCGRCFNQRKCCIPSISTTIQVEMLCPLNAADPVSIVQQQEDQILAFGRTAPTLASLWDTNSLDGIDQEFYQSHQMHIQNKFIAIEWILKCECSENEGCHRSTTEAPHGFDRNDNIAVENGVDDGRVGGGVNENNKNGGDFDVVNIRNNDYMDNSNNYVNDYSYFRDYRKIHTGELRHPKQIDDDVDVDVYNVNVDDANHNRVEDNVASPDRIGHKLYDSRRVITQNEEISSSLSVNSDESQPDIIPYPPPPFTNDKHTLNSIGMNDSKQKGHDRINDGNKAKDQREHTDKVHIDSSRNIQRQQQLAQQEKYFYEQWLLQQEQQKRQNLLLQQLWST